MSPDEKLKSGKQKVEIPMNHQKPTSVPAFRVFGISW
jgi:hypothetical protein